MPYLSIWEEKNKNKVEYRWNVNESNITVDEGIRGNAEIITFFILILFVSRYIKYSHGY